MFLCCCLFQSVQFHRRRVFNAEGAAAAVFDFVPAVRRLGPLISLMKKKKKKKIQVISSSSFSFCFGDDAFCLARGPAIIVVTICYIIYYVYIVQSARKHKYHPNLLICCIVYIV